MSLTTIRRGALVLLLDAATLLLLSELLSGFVLDGAGTALGAAALIGLLNSLVWPTLARLALPLTVLTLGIGALLLNGLLVTLAINAIPGARIDGVLEGTVVTIAMTAVTAVVYSLLAIDEDETWYRNVVRRQARLRRQAVESEVPCVLFLEIDGLAHDVLLRALQDGSAPTLAAWVRGGSHHLRCWETDWSSQTGACQAGLLHGSNEDMPAFRWWEKERGGGDRHQPPARRGRDRAPALGRPRAPPRRRRQPRQHPLRRRAALDADDEHGAAAAATDRPGLRRLLRPALRRRPYVGAGDRRHRARAARGAQPGPRRRAPQDRAEPFLRAGPRLGDGGAEGPAGGHRDRRRPRRAPGHLHDLSRL